MKNGLKKTPSVGSPEVEAEIVKKSMLAPFVIPYYDGLSIANIPVTVLRHMGADTGGRRPVRERLVSGILEGADRLVVMLIDGLGYDLVLSDSHRGKSVLGHLAESGVLFPVTSTFPSTTTTALATVNSGLTPQEHGIIGYTMYLRDLGLVANMISFSPAAEDRRDALVSMGLEPRSLLPGFTVYEALQKKGVQSKVLTRRIYKHSALSRLTHSGAAVETYVNSSDLFVSLRRILADDSGDPMYVFVYWDLVDTLSHIHGPSTEEVQAELENFAYSFKTQFLDKLEKKHRKRTTLIVTGDHGITKTPRDKAIMVQEHPDLLSCLKIPPTGDSRASFLHVRSGSNDEARDYLESRFGESLVVLESDQAVQDGFFGYGQVNKELVSRIGDLIVLPYEGYSFVYRYKRTVEGFEMKGSHGGLAKNEVLVPFLASRLG